MPLALIRMAGTFRRDRLGTVTSCKKSCSRPAAASGPVVGMKCPASSISSNRAPGIFFGELLGAGRRPHRVVLAGDHHGGALMTFGSMWIMLVARQHAVREPEADRIVREIAPAIGLVGLRVAQRRRIGLVERDRHHAADAVASRRARRARSARRRGSDRRRAPDCTARSTPPARDGAPGSAAPACDAAATQTKL